MSGAAPPRGSAPGQPPPLPPATVAAAGRPAWLTPLTLMPALVLLGGAAIVMTGGGDGEADQAKPTGTAGEIFLEPVASRGPDPFTDDVAASDLPSSARTAPSGSASSTAHRSTTSSGASGAGRPVPVSSVAGGTVGLYGGTLNDAVCDQAKMIGFLESHPTEAAAWAGVQGIDPSAIRDYVSRLTPVTLLSDTRVTNHGFSNGKAYPIQSVLQAGTAVLVDEYGVPRARCRCGNPLLPPAPVTSAPVYTGTRWPTFQPQVVVVVAPAPQPLSEIVIIDVETGDEYVRPVGTSGHRDRPTRRHLTTTTGRTPGTISGTTPVATSPGSAERPPGIPASNADATGEGVVVVSSIYGPEYPAALAIDGDRSTSWFADVSESSGRATFRWTGGHDDLITLVRITGNAQNADHPSGSGFASVTVRVLDEAGDVDFEQTVELPGSPDPTVDVWPGVDGRSVELVFEGAEGGDLAGFAELEVGVTR